MTAKAVELRSQGLDVLNFSVGEPDFNTPQNIINAAKNAMDSGFTKYTPGSGIRELKEAVCQKIDRDNNLNYTPTFVGLSEEFADKATFVKIMGDTDTESRALMKEWGVRVVPLFMLWKNGEKIAEWSGAKPDVLRENVTSGM